MAATDFQLTAQELLRQYLGDVHLEWSASLGATDSLKGRPDLYAPRTDIAIGPFNISPGRNSNISRGHLDQLPTGFRDRLLSLPENPNPRCLLAIEVTFSGSSKHIMGDILNASVMGMYGIVVAKPEVISKVHRNIQYLKALAELNKLPYLFQNVAVFNTMEFSTLLSWDNESSNKNS